MSAGASNVATFSAMRPAPPEEPYEYCRDFIQKAVEKDWPPSYRLIKFNKKLSIWEQILGISKVSSFPVVVGMPISNVCNARCLFCPYEPTRVSGSLAKLEDFSRANWLKFVSTFTPHSGLTEPMAHPQIAAILGEVRRHAPFIKMTMTTNASLMSDDVINVIVGHMRWMTVSINAARKETYERDMALDFDRTCNNLRQLARKKKEVGTEFPIVRGSVVVHRHNIDEIAEMPALFRDLGISHMRSIVMKVPAPIAKRKLFDSDDHIFHERDRANQAFQELAKQCDIHGIAHIGPIPYLPARQMQ